jgi:hypothetical protein
MPPRKESLYEPDLKLDLNYYRTNFYILFATGNTTPAKSGPVQINDSLVQVLIRRDKYVSVSHSISKVQLKLLVQQG